MACLARQIFIWKKIIKGLSRCFILQAYLACLLRISEISLFQFKNYPNARFQFTDRIAGICGKNGVGKTNLLDAVYYLCCTKSYFGSTDIQNTLHGASGFRIAAKFQLAGQKEQEIVCILRENSRKEMITDGTTIEKMSDHVGRIPCVVIAPDDAEIITGGSTERRRFIDGLICQLDAEYLSRLMRYNRVLQQRNGYLKSIPGGKADNSLLAVYDQQLVEQGEAIFKKRSQVLEALTPLIHQRYAHIAGRPEFIGVRYESPLQQGSFADLLLQSRQKDLVLQRTSTGIHRDDLILQLDDQPFKNLASQGQRKSLLFALKLAELALLQQHKDVAPLLLLDDVFEKLDEGRMQNLLSYVCSENMGQVLITDTQRQRLEMAFERCGENIQIIEIS